MNIKDIKAIVDLMKKNAVSEFEMEEGDLKIKLRREPNERPKGEVGVVQEAASDGAYSGSRTHCCSIYNTRTGAGQRRP